MKLPDFLDDSAWNLLRSHMKAELANAVSPPWEGMADNILKKLTSKGVTVPFEEIEIDPENGTFKFQDYRVLVYIKDQRYNPKYDNQNKEYKYHLCNCKTLEDFANRNQLDRYVVSRRTDGIFTVNIYNTTTRTYEMENIEKPMKVCKNCLLKLQYKGYADHTQGSNIYNRFELEEYFGLYPNPQFTKIPTHNADSAPKDVYTEDFPAIAEIVKERNGWGCSKCSVYLGNDKRFLHVHHKNGIKHDNTFSNLECLCIGCHSEELGHERMKFAADLKTFKDKFDAQRTAGKLLSNGF